MGILSQSVPRSRHMSRPRQHHVVKIRVDDPLARC
jgi:hypothetical protein